MAEQTLINRLFNLSLKHHNKLLTFTLYTSKILNAILRFLITFILIRKLNNATMFGKYSYYITVNAYLGSFFGFGFNSVINRVMAISSESENRNLSGAFYLINLAFSIIFIFAMLILSGFLLKGYSCLFLLAMVSQTILLTDIVNRIGTGSKNILALVLFETGVSVIVLLCYYLVKTDLYTYLLINFLVIMIVNNLIFFFCFRPSFTNLRENTEKIWNNVKKYGWHLYIGRMVSMVTYNLDKIILEKTAGVKYVGFYNLGLSCIQPITLFSTTFMSAQFRDITRKNHIPVKVLLVNTIWLLITSIAFVIIGKPIFILIFGESYRITTDYFPLFAIVAFLHGFFQPFDIFFSANGHGVEFRNRAVIQAIANVVFNFSLIPKFGLKGALYATIIALVLNNLIYLRYYFKINNNCLLKNSL